MRQQNIYWKKLHWTIDIKENKKKTILNINSWNKKLNFTIWNMLKLVKQSQYYQKSSFVK